MADAQAPVDMNKNCIKVYIQLPDHLHEEASFRFYHWDGAEFNLFSKRVEPEQVPAVTEALRKFNEGLAELNAQGYFLNVAGSKQANA